MKNYHGAVGNAFTYAMTIAGTPSIPEALSFAEVNGFDVTTNVPFSLVTGVETTITLPDGNIANYDSRWGLIEDDTLDKYLETVDDGSARNIISQDFDGRMEESRLSHKVDDILNRSASIRPHVLGFGPLEFRFPKF